jgi:hypothetical protein
LPASNVSIIDKNYAIDDYSIYEEKIEKLIYILGGEY